MVLREAQKKLERFCAYQERSPLEVERKMRSLGIVSVEERDHLMAQLMEDGFLDEYRFAELFIKSKLNQKQWAPFRIELELREHGIPQVLVQRLLNEVDAAQVEANACYLARRWRASKTDQQLMAALQRRGYSYEQCKHALACAETPAQ